MIICLPINEALRNLGVRDISDIHDILTAYGWR